MDIQLERKENLSVAADTENGKRRAIPPFEESKTDVRESVFTLEWAKVNYAEQGTVYLVMPDNIPAGVKIPVVIAVHGSGRSALDYRDTDFYAAQRNMALENGYGFAAISNGPDTWGLDDGLYNVNLLYDYLMANYPIQEKSIFWATSAGGTIANRMVAEHPEKVRCVIGTFPVYDLQSGFRLEFCQKAWGTNDLDEFKMLISGKNPAEYPEKLTVDYYIAHGNADKAVPLMENSKLMEAAVGKNIHLQIIEGGVHGTYNYSFYKGIVQNAFEDYPAVYTTR